MTPADLIPRLERCAGYWLARYPHLAGELAVGDLVSDGWLAWERARTWQRAEGAMRDRLAAEHRRRSRQVLLALPDRLPALEASRGPTPLVLPVTLAPLQASLLLGLAQGSTVTQIAAELGRRRSGAIYAHARRARAKLEASRIAERRRAAPVPRRPLSLGRAS